MELEWTMRDRVVPVAPALKEIIGGHNVIDFIVAHHALAKHRKTAQDRQHQDQGDQRIFKGKEFGWVFENWAFQPGRGCALRCHTVFDLDCLKK